MLSSKNFKQSLILSSNNIFLNIFIFNNNKYIKIFNNYKSCYFLINGITLKKKGLKVALIYNFNKLFFLKSFNYLNKYFSQFSKINRKKLIIKGLGYKINSFKDNNLKTFLEFKLGYSHPKIILLPIKIKDYYLTKNSITFESFNLIWLGNFIKRLQFFRKPDAYKHKGLHIKNQKLLSLKAVKKK